MFLHRHRRSPGLPSRRAGRSGRGRIWYGRVRVAAALLGLTAGAVAAGPALATPDAGPRGQQQSLVRPIDPQNWRNPDDMTWAEYRSVPGTRWADPALQPTQRKFKGALVLLDYPDEEFSVSKPAGAGRFGNPQPPASGIPRDRVPAFYRDFLNKPGTLNHGHTINEYWMEDSGGRFGVDLTAFGAYRLPWKSYQYGIEPGMNPGACPRGDTCGKDIRADGKRAWVADVGADQAGKFDFVFYLTAGVDESSAWQEFGQMKFRSAADVPAAWGPPSPLASGGNAAKTRYVPWTSWQAAARIWPNAADGSSTQAESSGMATFAHELSHILGIGDNYNNPYGTPLSRSYTGIWGMLSRGSFNGPGGPHTRWRIPATAGGSMGAQHVLRDKMKLGIVDDKNVLRLDRDDLKNQGLIVARVTARSAPPGDKGLSGINVSMGRDLSPACDRAKDPLCDGGGYDNYTVEVVDRMGMDSFTPDHGVLISKTKNADRAPFAWVIDAHPEDIGMVDFKRPDGTLQKITMGDYRQLSDALFHAGADSGSSYEYVDQANRLHFYVLDIQRDATGVLSYSVGVKSLDGTGPQARGAALGRGTAQGRPVDGRARCTFDLANTGRPAEADDGYRSSDVYRLSATASGRGWTAWLPNRLATARAGASVPVDVSVAAARDAARDGKITLTARSESDPGRTATAICTLRKSGR
ncbi:M6 family metalloprotease domain-containing protein [Streptomyces mobaraensis NBRC 13819 = DSM 40847]|uniref:M6 family metalloprotease domain-containing protein n=1 Tax=Streptomyces mobaraensis (strain ATCC 29032 / DSM 40847 / JCM 4168 / NBRC 13819 / NCIMB 11159 / IPCR 16-22) TaxID=1223523 RepID=M3CCZ8_STRM1|nr:M6 family metalloprotease domain-containing protein [Streptomyces mobaraensis]EMF01876.1 M6 family metalloprotease domain-containing protein [Streptomyces mobaraensis NBRC 13819 = DSM 40847]QTT74862.1 M6 family metalloprotease domain-containing protein [Streptomyces mobaraensis NBRC 13819 = DSM 40847]